MIRGRALVPFLVAATLCGATTPACTVIRYRDPPDAAPPMEDAPPPVVDLLVLVDLEASTAGLATTFDELLGQTLSALAEARIEIRRVGVAPLRRRVGDATPLLAGGSPEEIDLATAITAYTTGELASFLDSPRDDEYSNLLELGARLDSRPLYQPTPGDPGSGSLSGAAFFPPAADGWVVLTLSPRAPACGSSGCGDTAARHASAVLQTDASGNVGWLAFPGGGALPPSRVFHVSITPPEVGASYAALSAACTARPNFPVAVLDAIQPSDVYRSEVARALVAGGARARWLDLCGVLSSEGPGILRATADEIARAL